MATASTKKSSGAPVLNKTRSVIKNNDTIQISKLSNRNEIHGKFGRKRNIRDRKMRAVQIALMGNMAKMTISSLNRTRMGKRSTRIQDRGIRSHVKRSP